MGRGGQLNMRKRGDEMGGGRGKRTLVQDEMKIYRIEKGRKSQVGVVVWGVERANSSKESNVKMSND